MSKWTGPQLVLRPAGQAEQRRFMSDTFSAALSRLAEHEDWARFADVVANRFSYPADKVEAVVQQHRAWVAEAGERKRQRAEARAAVSGGPSDDSERS